MNILITALMVIATAAGALYAFYPHGQPIEHPGVRPAIQTGQHGPDS